jgi:hypothetical protein
VTLDDGDRDLLEFLAAHRLVLADHLTVVLGNRDLARRHLGGLLAGKQVRRERVMRSEPDCFQITRAGLASIGSKLPPPEFDPRYRHDVGVAWMWLAARGGAWGPAERIMTEREMRSRDERRARDSQDAGADSRQHQARGGPRFGIRLPDEDENRLHYPDLLLTRGRRRVAVELQLATPSLRRLGRVLSGYGADKRISAILFAVADPGVGAIVRSTAAKLETPPVVHIQPARLDDAPYPVRPDE